MGLIARVKLDVSVIDVQHRETDFGTLEGITAELAKVNRSKAGCCEKKASSTSAQGKGAGWVRGWGPFGCYVDLAAVTSIEAAIRLTSPEVQKKRVEAECA